MNGRRLLFGMLPTVSLLLGVSASLRAEALHPTGLIFEDFRKAPSFHEVKHVPVARGAKAYGPFGYADLLSQVPPIGDQGMQGSCTAWGTAYYHKTQLEWAIHHWDLNQPEHQFSPAFVYNQINGGGDNGSNISTAALLMCEQGCANLSEFPYDQSDCTTWPSESVFSHAIPYHAYGWNYINTNDTASLANVKQLLNNGSTCVLGISVWGNFDDIASYNYTYCSSDRTGSNRGGHAVCIVGYDDTMSTHDGPGAFKLVNSWGTGWGRSGVWWMSYQAVLDAYLSSKAVVYLQDTCDYQPTMLARVRIAHAAREQVGIRLVAGTRDSSVWSHDLRSWRHTVTDQPFPSHNIVFDMSDAEPHFKGGAESLYLRVTDDNGGDSGVLGYFSVQYLPWQVTCVVADTPAPIPSGGEVWRGTRIPARDVGVVKVIDPSGSFDTTQSVVPKVRVKNPGVSTASFPVKLRIGSYYRDSAVVTNLSPGASLDVNFPPWTARTRGTTLVRCSTGYRDDQIPGNDTLDSYLSVRVKDVGFVAIVSPADTVDSGVAVTPRMRVRNFGTTNEGFYLAFWISGDGYGQTVVCRANAGTETTATFPAWTPHTRGPLALRCSVALTGDANPLNDLGTGTVTVRGPNAVTEAEAEQAPRSFSLAPGRPNPFRGPVTIRYGLPASVPVRLAIYSLAGELVRVLRTAGPRVGFHEVIWDGRDDRGGALAQGVYLCRLEAGGFSATRQLLKLRPDS